MVFVIIFPIATADTGQIEVNIFQEDCIIDFQEGWNLFSFCKNLNDNNLANVLSSISDKYRYVMVWDETQQSFEIYSPRASQNPFTTFNDNYSYFIYMYEQVTLDISGSIPPTEQRNLPEGWTTPAYQYDFSTAVADIFQNTWVNFRYIMKWDNINQEFQIYSKSSSNNPFTQINSKEGRFIYMYDSSTIDY